VNFKRLNMRQYQRTTAPLCSKFRRTDSHF